MEAVLFPIVAPTTNIVICSVVRSVDSRSIWMANIIKICLCSINTPKWNKWALNKF